MIKSKSLIWAGHGARTGEMRNKYRILVGKPQGKSSVGRHARRWEDNIKTYLRGTVLVGGHCIHLDD
jgi:hypothetical protein